MTAHNPLLASPPYEVEKSLNRLGTDIRTARLRRNLTIAELAEKIGTGPRAVRDAEQGKPSSSIAVYAAALWALDLLHQLDDVARPENDEEGQALARSKENGRARKRKGLDNDF